MYRKCLKRPFDIFVSLFAILLLSPIFLLLAVIIKIGSRGPVFFKQDRIGRKKRLFKVLKFRTMRTDTPTDVPTHLLEDPQKYITKAGRFMRKTSLDELPQLFNILSGKMSLVGPRPALYNQDDLVAERDNYGANDVRPGLTGLAQVNGRDELPIPVKAKLDGDYVLKITFLKDMKILFKTAFSMFSGKGVKEGKTEGKTTEITEDNAEKE